MDEIKKFAVFGNPVNHSLSPVIHKEFAKQQNLNIQYKMIEPESDDFETHAQSFFSKKGIGANVTIPFKNDAYKFADDADEISRECESSNTLWFNGEKIKAFNTDGQGFLNDLTNKQISLEGLNILLLGAGGSARSIIHSISGKPIKSLSIYSRSQEKIDRLVDKYSAKIRIESYSDGKNFDFIINTTPVSMYRKDIEFPKGFLNSASITYDLFYTKDQTKFQKWSLDNGANKSYNGLGMLIEQAALSYEIWNNFKPNTKGLESII